MLTFANLQLVLPDQGLISDFELCKLPVLTLDLLYMLLGLIKLHLVLRVHLVELELLLVLSILVFLCIFSLVLFKFLGCSEQLRLVVIVLLLFLLGLL